MARNRKVSNAGSAKSYERDDQDPTSSSTAQELGSMYDYLAKIILIGPSGSGKSCILHRFLRGEWRALSSQTIGVEFGSKIIALGSEGGRRTRIKLQLWDTAGTERFRSVSRSYYRGAAGALMVYDVSSYASFAGLPTFLRDARNLASPRLSVVLVGNKVDIDEETAAVAATSTEHENLSKPSTRAASLNSKASESSFAQADSDAWRDEASSDTEDLWGRQGGGGGSGGIDVPSTPRSRSSAADGSSIPSIPPTPSSTTTTASSAGSVSTVRHNTGSQRATRALHGREVDASTAARWASSQGIPVSLEGSALSGAGVDQAFRRLAQMILTKIELGEIDPDDPQSGIQYGDAGYWGAGGFATDDGASVKSNATGGLRRRKGKKGGGVITEGLREWEAVFRLDRGSRGAGGRKRGCC